ncbi:MAG: hypothetical protein PF448_13705 [Bacteroidales bacterium]|jgi:hypothetical protein|nr:hypothetical protein [Bacteroidales bacterium]
MKAKQVFFIILLIGISLCGYSQRTLTETETQWVIEAKENLDLALSDPSLPESERLEMIKKSAQTLKEYGQDSDWPDGDLPIKELMDENFDQCKEQISEMTAWTLHLENESLENKLKLINDIQIEVVEDQIEMLIPGSTPLQLSSEVIKTVFDVNLVEGINGGARQSAGDLTDRFKALANQRELISRINMLIKYDKESMRLIAKDRKELETKIPAWEKAYNDAEGGAFTMKGYEGAILAGNQNQGTQNTISSNSITGTWRFGYEQTGYFIWTFKSNGEFTFEDRMNGEDIVHGKYSVRGNILKLTGPKHLCESVQGDYYFTINYGDLHFTKIEDKCIQRSMTLNHDWSRY